MTSSLPSNVDHTSFATATSVVRETRSLKGLIAPHAFSLIRQASTLGLMLGLALWATDSACAETLPTDKPESVGMNSARLDGLKELALQGIADRKMPGCVVCVGRHGRIVYREAFGLKKVAPDPEMMTVDTVFDMASITKPVATATSIMQLVEDGKLRLGDRVTKFFPEFGANGKETITIKHLLIHQSGLIPDNSIKDYQDGPDVAWEKICKLGLVAPIGETFKYSDVNFIVLAKLIEKISGQNVHEFSHDRLFRPLGMNETGFNPPSGLRARAAPTEKRDGEWMRGEVHDPRAYRLDGIAGHAGLFSTATDLATYAHMMLGRGTLRAGQPSQVRILAPQTVQVMTSPYRVSSGIRGLGWDKQTGYSSNRGDLLSPSAFGHGGFTGTVLWIDPELDLFFIFLSNRVHPNGKGSVNHLAGQMVNRVVSAIQEPAGPPPTSDVWTGIDVLRRDNFDLLRGQRIGLITNHTGRTRDGTSTILALHKAENVELAALFSPEHGIAGKLDVSKISDSSDAKTGLKVFSLYGATRRPTPEMLSEVDTIVFDIQDIGTRFYTYISTMGEAMEAAAEEGKRFVVLDRPNPIGGVVVNGPMLDRGKESFVGFHSLPVRHGMTIGEIAQLLKTERKLDLKLDIVRCEGWRRAALWDTTNLTWINPSPNMRSLTQALLYPGVGLLETTNVSVGRGTDTPFEVVGAPWINGRELAKRLNERQLPGVTFVPIEFTPDSSKHASELCQGINILITNRDRLQPIRCGLEIASALRALYPDKWDIRQFNRLLSNDSVYKSIVEGQPISETLQRSQAGLSNFKRRREQFLLYEN